MEIGGPHKDSDDSDNEDNGPGDPYFEKDPTEEIVTSSVFEIYLPLLYI